MAKKKKRKEAKNSITNNNDFIGLILILIGIIGMGFGPIGKFVKEFAMFLMGEYFFIVLIVLIILGAMILFKRKMPNFFSQKLISLYLVILILLILAHFSFLKKETSFNAILKMTYENYMERIGTISTKGRLFASGDSTIVIGGGFIGAVFAGILGASFGIPGTIIVIIMTSIFALIIAFDITVADIFSKITSLFKKDNDNLDDETPHKEYILDGDELVGIKDSKNDKIPQIDFDPSPSKKEEEIVLASIDELKNLGNKNNENTLDDEPLELHNNESFDKDFEEQTYETNEEYRLPKFDLLSPSSKKKTAGEELYIKDNQKKLERVLKDFDINGKVVDTHIGPAVTEYEITVSNGTKINKITNINKEIALAMAAKDVRIQAPIPGKSTIGIEIPNKEVASVSFREVLESSSDAKSENKILVALGKDIMGKTILTDLAKMPHLLVAGSTGSGKSVCINTIICSILMRYKPNEVKLVLVDPKKVELSNYNGIPHLLCPVVTDPKRASATLQKIVAEMEKRYELFSEKEVKNIAGYNEWVVKENKKTLDNKLSKMSYIVVIIDELADLMMVASKEVQDSIMRITQMARAAGIHLIVATQRPSTDIITGVIKNNIPSRIAFAVSSSIDSRTILDQSGAERLLGRGDMLFAPMGEAIPTRVQGCFISDDEIARLIDYCKTQGSPKFNEEFNITDNHTSSSGSSNSDGGDEPMYDEIVEFAMQTGKISASLIQRRFRFGYNRAARVIDLLESRGIIGPQNGSKPREVLIKNQDENDN